MEIQGATPTLLNDAVTLKRPRWETFETRTITSAPAILDFESDRYALALSIEGGRVDPAMPVPVVFYDDKKLVFTVKPIPAPPAPCYDGASCCLESML
ncbi:hypothetical protein MBUL_03177 [Methylobacterium bullatum]|uniref:Uncharacterized protein n=1 Tax=Methylobacterium bullatum TaxID=570505 RepID=A0A679JC91_9HYPH|nr:hypothetical protein MBUL_03177 [Methylobacterium bullatum]